MGESLTGGATSTHLPNESCVSMNVGTASGDKVIRQTHKYHRYQPGKSQLIMMTALVGGAKTNLRKRFGYFDAKNGIFFEQSDNTLKVARRSFTSGNAIDTTVSQVNWNIDKLDGTGASGISLDITKTQILVMDLAWLGTGRVRFGFYFNGQVLYCHEFSNENLIDTVYMSTANLPVRIEIENTGITVSASSIKQICTTIISEGGRDLPRGLIEYSVSTGSTLRTSAVKIPVLTLRPTLLFNNIENRGLILANRVTLFARSTDCYYEVIRNGTLGGTPSWVSSGPNSMSEFDIAATSITGGDRLFEGYVSNTAAGNADSTSVNKIFAQDFDATSQSMSLSLNFDGTIQDTLSVVVTPISGTADIGACIDFIELY